MDSGEANYRRFLSGDDDGFVEIVKSYKDGLTLYLHTFTGSLHTAEDLMEDTFFKLITRRPHFSGRSSFKTWLYAIGRNTAVDHLRRQKRRASLLPEQQAEEESLEQAYLKQEEKLALHRAISRLKPQYRQVLYLLYFEGFPNADAARVMKKSKRQIENLSYRAKQALKVELEKGGFAHEGL